MAEKVPVYHHFFTITIYYWLQKKSKIFNFFSTKQCSLIDAGSTLPSLFPLIPGKSPDVDFAIANIKNIIGKLDSNKVHCDDMISGRRLLCDKPACKSL